MVVSFSEQDEIWRASVQNRNKRRPPQRSKVCMIALYWSSPRDGSGQSRYRQTMGWLSYRSVMTRFHLWMVCFRDSNEILRSKLQNMPKLEVRIMVFAFIFWEFFNAFFALISKPWFVEEIAWVLNLSAVNPKTNHQVICRPSLLSEFKKAWKQIDQSWLASSSVSLA